MKISRKKLIDVIDKEFWKVATQDSNFTDVNRFEDIELSELLTLIANKLYDNSYNFGNTIEIYSPKSMGILRKKELFRIDDACIYYYCVKLLEQPIIKVIKNNNNVFGAFRMTKDLRFKKREIETNSIDNDEISGYGSVLAKEAYTKDWNEYQVLAEELYEEGYDFYISLDIAHFYNDINLDTLEKQLRAIVEGEAEAIDLLFHLLRTYKKSEFGFYPSNRSLPQSDIGEMSRILANLYLSTFDTAAIARLDKILEKDNYTFTRYSDDIWVAIKGGRETAFKVIQIISFELLKLELFINEGKMQILNKDDFGNYWCFDIWHRIFALKRDAPEDHRKWMKIIEETVKMSEKPKTQNYRWFSPQLYALKIVCSFKNPAKYFNTAAKAAKILNIILGTEKNLDKANPNIRNLVYLILQDHPHLRPRVENMIGTTLYPSMEYFALNISIGLDNNDKSMKTYDKYCQIYLRSFSNKWQWYSRCLVLKFLSSHASYIEDLMEI